jgi:hypothetical protein
MDNHLLDHLPSISIVHPDGPHHPLQLPYRAQQDFQIASSALYKLAVVKPSQHPVP